MTTKDAVARVGSVTALANALGISRQAIYQWRGVVPPLRVYQIREILTDQQSENQ